MGAISDAGPALWIDASNATSIWEDAAGTNQATANNDVVRRVDDLSGNGRHMVTDPLSPGNETWPKLITSAQNGLNALRFLIDLFVFNSDLAAGGTFDLKTCYIAFKKTGSIVSYEIIVGQYSGLTYVVGHDTTTSTIYNTPSGTSYLNNATTTVFDAVDTPQIITRIHDGTSYSTAVHLGGQRNNDQRYFTGDVYEMACFTTAHDSTTRTAIFDELSAKWDIAAAAASGRNKTSSSKLHSMKLTGKVA